jgi:hypothetical protein
VSETQLVSSILDALAIEPGVVAWRNNNGTIKRGRRYVRFGLSKGAADIVAIVGPAGRFLALECKTAKGKQSQDQIDWALEVKFAGGLYAMVRSVQEARDAVRAARSTAT